MITRTVLGLLGILLLFGSSTLGSADPVEKDYIYKKTPQGELRLVVTLPPEAKPDENRSAIVFFSGGAWANSNLNQFKEIATYLAGRGMVAVRADYRVSKKHNVGPDKCVEDARSALRWVREHAGALGVDPNRIAASGASAGGHLAACTATPVAPDAETDNLEVTCVPAALVLINCVADLTFGGLATRAGGPEMARRISPVQHVSANTPPTLILDGSEDNWVSTAKQFTDKATSAGARCEFYIAQGQGHQFIARSPWREATIHKIDEFFGSLGWLSGPPTVASPKAAVWVRYQSAPAAPPEKASAQPGTPPPDPKTDLGDKRAKLKKLLERKKKAGEAKPEEKSPQPPPVSVGPVTIEVATDKAAPINPRVYGTWCEEMFTKGLANEPEYIAALVDLKFKTFLFPGGSLSYYHHPKGPGGFNIRPEEVARSKYGAQGPALKDKKADPAMSDLGAAIIKRYLDGNSDLDYFETYIRFVKASGGEAVFVANILNGAVDELDQYLTRLKAERIPIAAVVLGVEMHLGPAKELGAAGYVERIKPFIAMLKAKYPSVPIVAHSTPVGRAVELARAPFHEWNQTLSKLPGINGFSQYGWTEFLGQPRLQLDAAKAKAPGDPWRQYDEFVRTFPSRQITAYQKDWGNDKKMYLTQWGAHADQNTAVHGVHVANFYFFLAEYNAAHDDYFPIAATCAHLGEDVSRHARIPGPVYREKIVLPTPYLYTKPLRHLFSGETKLLTATVQAAGEKNKDDVVKALAAVGGDGCQYVYMLNRGAPTPLGNLSVDGQALPSALSVKVESAWDDPAAKSDVKAPPVKTFTGEKLLRDVVLEGMSLTLLIVPADAARKPAPADKSPPKPAADPVKKPAPSDTPATDAPRPKKGEPKVYDKNAGPRPDLEDIAYGTHERLKLDLWKAKSDQPTPVLVFFHGGGGDKLMYRGHPLLMFCLESGISAAAVNYRPRNQAGPTVPTEDAARAIQFLRSKAAEYNVDPKRIASFGTSLGANVSIALAYNADLAKPKSDDPVLRESSRLAFVITADAGGGFTGSLGAIAKDAPPIFMNYNMTLKEDTSLKDTPKKELLHNPIFGLMLKRKLDAAGVENHLYHGGVKSPPDAEQRFILKQFFAPAAQLSP